jgi:hypothetical protein
MDESERVFLYGKCICSLLWEYIDTGTVEEMKARQEIEKDDYVSFLTHDHEIPMKFHCKS